MINKKKKKGFTLIELIVVIAILGILAAIAIPRLGGFTESANQASDKEAAALLANSGAMYHATHPTDASITTAEMITDGLIVAGDLATKSTRYATDLSDTNITLNADGTVTVVMGDYSITK